jgi:hypothetical protein
MDLSTLLPALVPMASLVLGFLIRHFLPNGIFGNADLPKLLTQIVNPFLLKLLGAAGPMSKFGGVDPNDKAAAAALASIIRGNPEAHAELKKLLADADALPIAK